MDYQLVVLQGRSAVKTIRLIDGTTTVGRQDGCELTVRSSQVSRKHCQLFEKKGLLLVKDLGSANGTFVNGDRIEEQRVLEPGDELTVGPIKFRVEKATAASPPAGAIAEVKPSDTVIPEAVEAPIALDDDDVLEFVTGIADDPQPSPPTKPAKAAPAPAPAPTAAAAPSPSPRKEPAPAAKAATKVEPAPQPGEADEAIAEFLMGIEIDEEDRR